MATCNYVIRELDEIDIKSLRWVFLFFNALKIKFTITSATELQIKQRASILIQIILFHTWKNI